MPNKPYRNRYIKQMIHNLLRYTICIAILAGLFSCSKEYDGLNDYNTRKNNLIGDWQCHYQRTEYQNDSLFWQEKNDFSISIYSDGTAAFRPDSISPPNKLYKWFYQFDPQKIIFKAIDNEYTSAVLTYPIVSLSENYMEWNISSSWMGTTAKYKMVDEYFITRIH